MHLQVQLWWVEQRIGRLEIITLKWCSTRDISDENSAKELHLLELPANQTSFCHDIWPTVDINSLPAQPCNKHRLWHDIIFWLDGNGILVNAISWNMVGGISWRMFQVKTTLKCLSSCSCMKHECGYRGRYNGQWISVHFPHHFVFALLSSRSYSMYTHGRCWTRLLGGYFRWKPWIR